MTFSHVAFLRGMNLGRRRITNPELVAAFEAIGFAGAVAFQASGNVLFDADARNDVAARIASGLERELGYPVPTFLRTADQVRRLAAAEPFPATGETRGKLQVTMLATVPDQAAIASAEALDTRADRIRVIGAEWFWWPIGGVSDSRLDLRALERALGAGTTRTQTTLQRISGRL
jgi:uncharacterized protein (DUF1697 family)